MRQSPNSQEFTPLTGLTVHLLLLQLLQLLFFCPYTLNSEGLSNAPLLCLANILLLFLLILLHLLRYALRNRPEGALAINKGIFFPRLL
ncbi:hypothetical protein GDO81_028456 [Engystomops pustulosus]|uniref:Uncharacterized protein n=1 Tax=Engystomops pustulosus TaxID=76066 RepID=A0AAV6YEM2_ENGPU|nr:hypothetical protein GDO81_028456 [Engystomops pustulosus]